MKLLRVKYDLWVDEWDDFDGETQVAYFNGEAELSQFIKEVETDVDNIYEDKHTIIVYSHYEANIIDLIKDYEANIIQYNDLVEYLAMIVLTKRARKGLKIDELENKLKEKGIL